MKRKSFTVTLIVGICGLLSISSFAQNPITADSPFQVRYAANLNVNDSFVNITNTGASGGNICEQVYVYDPREELIACCTCTVTPNGLESISVKKSLTMNALNNEVPNSVVVELVSTNLVGSACDASTLATAGQRVAGTAAWMTTAHPITVVTPGAESWELPTTTIVTTLEETPFTPSTLGAGEYAHNTTFCAFNEANGSGAGICAGCQSGGQ
jgi:hypothetical protein